MINEVVKAFFLVFIAELGDKTQLLAMSLATRYSVKKMYIGMALGLILNHGLAILLGKYISMYIPIEYIQLITGCLFIAFGIMSLNLDEMDCYAQESLAGFGPIMTVGIIFFIGELGDKTQLTAMAFSANATFRILVLIATVLGVLASCTFGIILGKNLHQRVPEYLIKIFACVVFVGVGTFKLISHLPTRFSNSHYVALLLAILSLLVMMQVNQRIKKLD